MTDFLLTLCDAASNAMWALLYPVVWLADHLHWQEGFRVVFNLGVNGAWAVLAVVLLRAVLRLAKAPKKYAYALWAVAAFRFVCPVSFTVDAVFSLLPSAGQEAIPADIGYQAVPQLNTGSAAVDRVVNSVLPAPQTAAASVNPMQIVLAACGVVWGVGVLVFLARAALAARKLRKRMTAAAPLPANRLAACGAPPAGRSPLWRLANAAPVVTLPGAENAFVYGVLRPRICLPAGLSDTARRCVLAHERTHIARADHLWKLLAFCILCVHWFNPFAWLAFWLMERDMEMSCDEAVLARLGGSGPDGAGGSPNADYAQSLLDLAAKRPFGALNPVAFGESGVAGRIKHALNYKKPAFWVSLAALVLVAVVGFGLAADPEQHDPADPVGGSAASSAASSGADASLQDEELIAAAAQSIEAVQADWAEFYRVVIRAAGADKTRTVPDENGDPYWPVTGEPGYTTTKAVSDLYQRVFSGGAYDLTGDDGSGRLFVTIDGQLCRAAVEIEAAEQLSTQITALSGPKYRETDGSLLYLTAWVAEPRADGEVTRGYRFVFPAQENCRLNAILDENGQVLWGGGMENQVYPLAAQPTPRPALDTGNPQVAAAREVIAQVQENYRDYYDIILMGAGVNFSSLRGDVPYVDPVTGGTYLEVNEPVAGYDTPEALTALAERTLAGDHSGLVGQPGSGALYLWVDGTLYRREAEYIESPTLPNEIVAIERFTDSELLVLVNEYSDTAGTLLMRYQYTWEDGRWTLDLRTYPEAVMAYGS